MLENGLNWTRAPLEGILENFSSLSIRPESPDCRLQKFLDTTRKLSHLEWLVHHQIGAAELKSIRSRCGSPLTSRAVNRMIGSRASRFPAASSSRIVRATRYPFSPGSMTSSTTRSGSWGITTSLVASLVPVSCGTPSDRSSNNCLRRLLCVFDGQNRSFRNSLCA